MKKIVLHIGLGKTGTTSVQQFLSLNNPALLKEGVHYIQAAGGAAGHGHQNIAKSCIDEVPYYMHLGHTEQDISAVQNEMVDSQSEVILFSSENFQLANPLKVKAILDEIDQPYECSVILIVRSQDELLESEYNQMVKFKGISQSLDEYARTDFNGDYMTLAAQWQSIFGPGSLISRVHDSSKQNAIPNFLSCLPIRSSSIKRLCGLGKIVSNQSLDLKTLSDRYLKNCNRPPASNTDIDFSLANGPAILMNSTEAKVFRQRFHASNLMFSQRFLNRPMRDLGGTRYSDSQRDKFAAIWDTIQAQ